MKNSANHQSLKYMQFSGEILAPGAHSFIKGQRPHGVLVNAGMEVILSWDFSQLDSLYFDIP